MKVRPDRGTYYMPGASRPRLTVAGKCKASHGFTSRKVASRVQPNRPELTLHLAERWQLALVAFDVMDDLE